MRRTLSALILFFSVTVTAASAERLPFRVYTTTDGLADDRIKCIVPDSRGFIWFCAPGGLSRFDGQGFTTYAVADGPTPNRSTTSSKRRVVSTGWRPMAEAFIDSRRRPSAHPGETTWLLRPCQRQRRPLASCRFTSATTRRPIASTSCTRILEGGSGLALMVASLFSTSESIRGCFSVRSSICLARRTAPCRSGRLLTIVLEHCG